MDVFSFAIGFFSATALFSIIGAAFYDSILDKIITERVEYHWNQLDKEQLRIATGRKINNE